MTQNSELRLKKIMDKLYHSPIHRQPAFCSPRGREMVARAGTDARALTRGPALKEASCRPWDRSDLIRRLSTFKAMTWFGKPKDINPLNCARRGWINVEMDVIVCEACEARLLFSTSPSWPLEQVEKAAKVFSLKLDNGHKLLCPWINNACDESLAFFPPSPPQALIKGFEERSNALLQLSSLPVISSLTLDYMNCPQLDRLLSSSFKSAITLNNGIRLIDDCGYKDLHNAAEDHDFHGYRQALKIISLCGWEPRLLPYTVEFDGNCPLESLDPIPCEQPTPSITKFAQKGCNKAEESKEICPFLGENIYDQSSAVLDCKFCGACVGFWSFRTILRPLELFKININDIHQSELASGTLNLSHGVEFPRAENFSEKPISLHLTIAGGPLPAKQCFRPKVSLPAVSRHIRAELKRKRSEVENSTSQLYLEGNDDSGSDFVDEVGTEHTSKEINKCTDLVVRDDFSYQIVSVSHPTDARESNNFVSRLFESSCVDKPENEHCNHSVSTISSVINTGDTDPCFQNGTGVSIEDFSGPAKKVSVSLTWEEDYDHLSGNLKPKKAMDFDPIKQHRPFCPWICEGKNEPGWKATLSALDSLENNSSPQQELRELPSNLFDEDDDPILSVRKLFASPPGKRHKRCQ